jgi:hypothetical protein
MTFECSIEARFATSDAQFHVQAPMVSTIILIAIRLEFRVFQAVRDRMQCPTINPASTYASIL